MGIFSISLATLSVSNIAQLASLNVYPLGDGPVSQTGQFK